MRQVYMGSDHHVEVGSFPMRGELDPDDKGSVLGFRLVHDEVGRVARGGSWYFTADLAGEENRYWSFSTVQSPMVGLRIVADWSGE